MFSIRKVVVSLRKAKTWVKIAIVMVPLALAGYLGWIFVVTPLISCGPDVQRVDEQCIGVTDGRVVLRADLTDVLGKIQQENDRVEKIRKENEDVEGDGSKPVSVAYLMPMSKPSSNDEQAIVIQHELEGAYVAQLQANRTKVLGDKPLIRLLVANSGDESSHGQQVVSDLLAKVSGPERLVTVVATGNTKRATIDAINALRSGRVPVVTSLLAGDSLPDTDPAAPAQVEGGLARLAPTGSDQAAAAAAYLRPTASRALMVRDANPQDPFLASLYEGFRRTFQDGAHTVLEPTETYDSRLPGYPNTMTGMLRNICQQKPDVVFFAGRAPALAAFVEALPKRPCRDLPINIVSGGAARDFATLVGQGDQQLRDGLRANASVRYTTQAHPKPWEVSPQSFPPASTRQFTSTCDQCFNSLFPGQTLEDGVAIIGYDAIVTTVTAIRLGQGGINDQPDLISQEFKRMHGTDAVAGAEGWISLDDQGAPVNKAVVILEVKPDGTREFVKLSSPTGSPCIPGTPPC